MYISQAQHTYSVTIRALVKKPGDPEIWIIWVNGLWTHECSHSSKPFETEEVTTIPLLEDNLLSLPEDQAKSSLGRRPYKMIFPSSTSASTFPHRSGTRSSVSKAGLEKY